MVKFQIDDIIEDSGTRCLYRVTQTPDYSLHKQYFLQDYPTVDHVVQGRWMDRELVETTRFRSIARLIPIARRKHPRENPNVAINPRRPFFY